MDWVSPAAYIVVLWGTQALAVDFNNCIESFHGLSKTIGGCMYPSSI